MQATARIQHIKPSYIRDILKAASAEGVLSLAGGLPPREGFPLEFLRSSFASLSDRPELFQYGPTGGYQPLLDFLRGYHKLDTNTDLLIGNGSQQCLDLIARAFVEPGQKVAMEAPSYVGAMQVFSLAGANICTVDSHFEGPDLHQLETLFSAGDIKIFYAVPDFHNPTGRCWSSHTRQEVARLCIHHGVTLIEDAPYRDLRFSGDELPMVSSLCPQLSLVLRSFSKTAMPGMRLGFVTGPAQWIEYLRLVKQSADLHTAVPLQAVLLDLLQWEGYPDHLQKLKQQYKTRYQTLASALQRDGREVLTFDPVSGGMFIWATLLKGDCEAVARECLSRKVAVVPGSAFYPPGHPQVSALRLNFTCVDSKGLESAAQTLCEVLSA